MVEDRTKNRLLALYIVCSIAPFIVGFITYVNPRSLQYIPWFWLYLIPLVVVLRVASLAGEFKLERPGNWTLAATFLIVGVSVISASFTAIEPKVAWVYLVRNICLLLLAWMVYSGPHGRSLLRVILLGLTLWIALCYTVVAIEAGNPDYPWQSFYVGVQHVRHVGYLLVLYVGIAAGLAFTSERRCAFLLALLLGLTFVNLTGGRAAIVASIAAGTVAAVCAARWKSNLAILAGLYLLSVPLSLLFIPPNEHWGLQDLLYTLEGQAAQLSGGNGRFMLWERAWLLIEQQPLVGYGEGQFFHFVKEYGVNVLQPHSIYFQSLLTFGLIGSVGVTVLIGRALVVGRSCPARAAVVGTLLLGLLDGPLFYTSSATIFVICCAILQRGDA